MSLVIDLIGYYEPRGSSVSVLSSSFCNMKRLVALLLPLNGMLVYRLPANSHALSVILMPADRQLTPKVQFLTPHLKFQAIVLI